MSLNITMLGGNCPVQAEGTIEGQPFYFRARGEHWTMSIGGEDVVCDPVWHLAHRYGSGPFDAGWMSEGEAFEFINLAVAAWLATARARP